MLPGKPESMYEIGYILMKRPSIFILSSILMLNGLGMVTVYFLIFGNTFASFVADFSGKVVEESFIVSRIFYILILAVVILPVCLMRELQELHIVSVSLFIAVLTFIVILVL